MLLLYTTVLLVLFLFFANKKNRIPIGTIIIIAFLIRLSGIMISRNINNYNLQSYDLIGNLILKGVNIYPEQARLHFPYFPFFLYIEAITSYLGTFLLNQATLLKLVFIFFDVGIIIVLHKISTKSNYALLYAVNPISPLVSSIHGQFDSIPLFFFFIKLLLHIHKHKNVAGLLLASIAILVKPWPALFMVPLLLKVKGRLLPIIFIFPLLSVIVYKNLFHSNYIEIVKPIFLYRSTFGKSGLFYLLSLVPITINRYYKIIISLFSVFVLALFSYVQKRRTIYVHIVQTIMFFYMIIPTFAIQYISWVIPFLLIVKPKKWILYVITASVYLFLNYFIWQNNLHKNLFSIRVTEMVGLILWIEGIIIFIFLRRMPRAKARSALHCRF